VPGVCPVDRGARKSDWMCIYLFIITMMRTRSQELNDSKAMVTINIYITAL